MAIVKTLDILLRGKTNELGKDFDKASKIVKGGMARIASIASAVLPVLSIAGLTAGIGAAIKQLGDLEDRSFRFQIDINELAALERASNIAGVSIQGTSTALQKLGMVTALANDGSKKQVALFEKLGIVSKEFSQLTPTNQLIAVSEGLDSITDRTERASIAIGLFGKQGLSVLPLLSDGAKELRGSMDRLQELGGVFDPAGVALVGEFDDRLGDLKMSVGNLFKQLTIELAPALIELTKTFIQAIKPGTAFSGLFLGISQVVQAALVPLQILASVVNKLSNFFGTSTGQLIGYIAATAVVIRLSQQLVFVLQAVYKISKLTLVVRSALAALDGPAGLAKYAKAAAVFTAIAASIAALEANASGLFADTGKAATDAMKVSNAASQVASLAINPQSAAANSAAAFETIYGVKIQAPINQLVDATKAGNDILDQINAKLDQAGGIADDFDTVDGF